jgi:hypothetical protein
VFTTTSSREEPRLYAAALVGRPTTQTEPWGGPQDGPANLRLDIISLNVVLAASIAMMGYSSHAGGGRLDDAAALERRTLKFKNPVSTIGREAEEDGDRKPRRGKA